MVHKRMKGLEVMETRDTLSDYQSVTILIIFCYHLRSFDFS